VIQVPNRALGSGPGGTRTLTVLYGAEKKPVTIAVRTGATNGVTTEITSCVETNNQCLRAGDQVSLSLPTGNQAQRGGEGVIMIGPGGPGMEGPGPGVAPVQIPIGR
jgi:hypothetical protein